MANEMNVVLTANLTKDPELTDVGGKTVTRLSLAHNTRTKRGDQWENDDTWWIDATVWPRFDGDSWPENVAASLAKGDTVDLMGRLKREPWESRDGTKQGVSYRLTVQTIGVSLQRATVQVVRNQSRDAARPQSSGGWGQQAQAQPAWGQSAALADPEQQSFGSFDDEQPF